MAAGFYDNIASIQARDVATWPTGDNSSDTVFEGIHFNLDVLKHFNYTYYNNGTVSNSSKCYLTFAPVNPDWLYENGTFVNATKCYVAIKDIGLRGHTGIGFAVAFGVALVLTLTVLTKHGKTYLPREKRFYPIGRRWQWYWACFMCGAALISLFINVDVDRYYLQELPITVTVFFWYLICMGTVALTWEAVRHWGSWQERQYVDPNPFVYGQWDRRAKVEFWLPLWFYAWLWLNFFMVVPRSWTFTQLQRSPEQTIERAIPTTQGVRFKIAALCLFIAWLTIVFSLRHSIKHYRARNRGVFNRAIGLTRAIPLRFYLIIPLCLATIAYQAFICWKFEYSIIKYDGNVPVIFGWGYGPSLLILYIQVTYGFASPNEDKEIIRQRRVRGETLDQELGIVHKPAWWRRVRGDHLLTLKDKIKRNVNEVGGVKGVGRREETAAERDAREEALANALNDDAIEMHGMPSRNNVDNPRVDRAGVHSVRSSQTISTPYVGKNDRRRNERTLQDVAGILFPNNLEAERARRRAELGQDSTSPPPYSDRVDRGRPNGRPGSTGRSNSAETTNSITQPPQQIRSMLDI